MINLLLKSLTSDPILFFSEYLDGYRNTKTIDPTNNFVDPTGVSNSLDSNVAPLPTQSTGSLYVLRIFASSPSPDKTFRHHQTC